MKTSRRRFLAATPAAWLAAHWTAIPAIIDAQQHARHAAASPVPTAFQYLDAASAREIEAAAEQILPAGKTAGARDAGVVYFIDRALDRDARGLYRRGLGQLARRAARTAGRPARFSELPAEKQIAVLKEIEKTEFFETLLRHTLIGFFANPEHGGNRGGAGWRAIGFQDEPWFEPPFGTYDRNPEAK